MASAAKSCCACQAPGQHPRCHTSQATQPQNHIGFCQRSIASAKPFSAVCCNAMSGVSSIRAPAYPMAHSLPTVDPTGHQTFQARQQSCCDPDVVIITKACPHTVASLACSGESPDSISAAPCCRFPDAAVYMSRDTYNDLCVSVARTQCTDARERAMQAIEVVRFVINLVNWTTCQDTLPAIWLC